MEPVQATPFNHVELPSISFFDKKLSTSIVLSSGNLNMNIPAFVSNGG